MNQAFQVLSYKQLSWYFDLRANFLSILAFQKLSPYAPVSNQTRSFIYSHHYIKALYSCAACALS